VVVGLEVTASGGTPSANAGGFRLQLKAGLIGHAADYRHTTVKSSFDSGGC
jgi:hypothetical protein